MIALELNGDARAYPLQILTWHEIVNDTVGEIPITITFCPLCNSAIAFERHYQGTTYDFGTSGLLRHSDLVMYDRQTESLWQQFTGEAIVGAMTGEQLKMIPAGLIGFEQFQSAYPTGVWYSKETDTPETMDAIPIQAMTIFTIIPFSFEIRWTNGFRNGTSCYHQ